MLYQLPAIVQYNILYILYYLRFAAKLLYKSTLNDKNDILKTIFYILCVKIVQQRLTTQNIILFL